MIPAQLIDILCDFFYVCVCHAFLPVHSSLVVTCWERANLLALLFAMFSCVFSLTFPCGVLGQVRYLIVIFAFLLTVMGDAVQDRNNGDDDEKGVGITNMVDEIFEDESVEEL